MARDPLHPHSVTMPAARDEAPLDAANQQLAEALRKSFWVLKVIMLVLVILYFFSGWFSVQPGQQGFVTRFGRVLGLGGEPGSDPILGPGWHWSWPYPFDRWQTVPVNERELPVSFMFAESEEEKITGVVEYKYNMLSPLRDDYLITGDVNIIHATLVLKYRIGDPIAYARNVFTGAPSASDAPPPQRPEYGLLASMLRNAVIETAANRAALDIRGEGQEAFLRAVSRRMHQQLQVMASKGAPLGIVIDPENAVLAPKTRLTQAIRPPPQVQEEFERVFAKQNEKARTVATAQAEAGERLTKTAGPDHRRLVQAIDEEFAAMSALSEGEARPAAERGDLGALRADLERKRAATEALLEGATGEVQSVIKSAQTYRDTIINEAVADYAHVKLLEPEFARNRDILLSRMRDEILAQALQDDRVAKVYIPSRASQYWIKIPREKLPPASQVKAPPSPFVSSKAPAAEPERAKAQTGPQRQ